MLQATLTLPGIAAIALTLGMAIDANVLINERIREELRNGASPQQAIHLGFDRAWATIFDSNLTSLIVGVALLARSEEHTSDLQSLMRRSYAVSCLKKTTVRYATSSECC